MKTNKTSKKKRTRGSKIASACAPRLVDVTETFLVRPDIWALGVPKLPGTSCLMSERLWDRQSEDTPGFLNTYRINGLAVAFGFLMKDMERSKPGSTMRPFRIVFRDWEGNESVVQRDMDDRIVLLLPEESGPMPDEIETEWTMVPVAPEADGNKSDTMRYEARLVWAKDGVGK